MPRALIPSIFGVLFAFSSLAFSTEILVRAKPGRVPSVQIQGMAAFGTPAVRPLLKKRSSGIQAQASGITSPRAALERTFVITLPDGADLNAELRRWQSNPDVEMVEPNHRLKIFLEPNDSQYGDQWGLKNEGQAGNKDPFDPSIGTSGTDVDAEAAWDLQTGSSSVVIAIIDAGIAWAHSDLNDNIWSNTDENVNGIDTDGNGYIDDVRGYDFGEGDNDPNDTCSNANELIDASGHGTHVTGTAGAEGNNGLNVTGMSWSSRLMPLKVADDNCLIETDAVVEAMAYAVDNGADIINLSLGGPHSVSLETAVDDAYAAGMVIVAAAGNEGTNDESQSYPAAYDDDRVIAVAATDRNDMIASFSNYGPWITLAAPGVAIRSTYLSNSTAYLSGTSMASPLVAGIAALMLSDDPTLTPAEVRTRLINSCENINALNPDLIGQMGAGRVNALRSLLLFSSMNPSTAPNTGVSPVITLTGQNFSSSMTVVLTRTGQSNILGSGLSVNSVTSATVTFPLSGVQGGRWDAVITKGAGSVTLTRGFGVLTNSFDVVPLDPAQAYTKSVIGAAGTHTVVWPAGVFSQSVVLDIDAAPGLDAVGAADPYVATGIGVDLTPSVANMTFLKPFTLTLTYRLIDLPDPSQEQALTMARYDEDTARWVPLVSVVDTTAKTVTASISHLSQFAILQHTASQNLDKAIAFPNPFRVDRGHTRVLFDFLTAGSTVRLYDVSGALIRELVDDNNDGLIDWSVTNQSGENIASGIYFYLITDPSGNEQKGRLGVIR